jgi:hypothetical protein
MEAKHTPGPWYRSINGGTIRQESSDLVVAMIDDGGHVSERDLIPTGQCEANAHLIAAAPDLLEALEDYLKYSGGPFDRGSAYISADYADRDRKFHALARDTIAKAKGEAR